MIHHIAINSNCTSIAYRNVFIFHFTQFNDVHIITTPRSDGFAKKNGVHLIKLHIVYRVKHFEQSNSISFSIHATYINMYSDILFCSLNNVWIITASRPNPSIIIFIYNYVQRIQSQFWSTFRPKINICGRHDMFINFCMCRHARGKFKMKVLLIFFSSGVSMMSLCVGSSSFSCVIIFLHCFQFLHFAFICVQLTFFKGLL